MPDGHLAANSGTWAEATPAASTAAAARNSFFKGGSPLEG
jgi:hypothetical protein